MKRLFLLSLCILSSTPVLGIGTLIRNIADGTHHDLSQQPSPIDEDQLTTLGFLRAVGGSNDRWADFNSALVFGGIIAGTFAKIRDGGRGKVALALGGALAFHPFVTNARRFNHNLDLEKHRCKLERQRAIAERAQRLAEKEQRQAARTSGQTPPPINGKPA